jgi:antitoxin Xre/MbcA/ParS-like protein
MLPGAEMVLLGRQELDVWLGEPDDFVLAVLRDIYADESDVKQWLNSPHNELGGRSAVDLLSAGQVTEVESFLVEHWNAR